MCNTDSQTEFKTISSLCDYSDAYILVNGTLTITGPGADNIKNQADKKEKEAIFKNLYQLLNASAKQIILK